MKSSKTRCLGILTAGGDSPGLNAVVRAITKVAMGEFGMRVLGIQDGFRGLVENRILTLDDATVSGVLTRGGTILGTSRDKPHSMPMGGRLMDMSDAAVDNARKHQMDCVVCLGGGGTAKNAFRLWQKSGLNVMTLPKTIDNDVFGTDVSFGFDTAVSIATEAIDRLHTTATSHHRLIVCEVMGHRAGWLALHSGIAGGADVILLPELPYDLERIAEFLLERRRHGKRFSIIAVAEGAMSRDDARALQAAEKKLERAKTLHDKKEAKLSLASLEVRHQGNTMRLAKHLEELTQLESRVTILGYVQRGGTPSAADRILATRLGSACGDLINEEHYGVMVAARGDGTEPVPLEKVAGKRKTVPLDHTWLQSARHVGTCLGD